MSATLSGTVAPRVATGARRRAVRCVALGLAVAAVLIAFTGPAGARPVCHDRGAVTGLSPPPHGGRHRNGRSHARTREGGALPRPALPGAAGSPPLGAAGPPPLGAAGPPPLGAAGPPPVGGMVRVPFPEGEVLPAEQDLPASECCPPEGAVDPEMGPADDTGGEGE